MDQEQIDIEQLRGKCDQLVSRWITTDNFHFALQEAEPRLVKKKQYRPDLTTDELREYAESWKKNGHLEITAQSYLDIFDAFEHSPFTVPVSYVKGFIDLLIALNLYSSAYAAITVFLSLNDANGENQSKQYFKDVESELKLISIISYSEERLKLAKQFSSKAAGYEEYKPFIKDQDITKQFDDISEYIKQLELAKNQLVLSETEEDAKEETIIPELQESTKSEQTKQKEAPVIEVDFKEVQKEVKVDSDIGSFDFILNKAKQRNELRDKIVQARKNSKDLKKKASSLVRDLSKAKKECEKLKRASEKKRRNAKAYLVCIIVTAVFTGLLSLTGFNPVSVAAVLGLGLTILMFIFTKSKIKKIDELCSSKQNEIQIFESKFRKTKTDLSNNEKQIDRLQEQLKNIR